MSFQYIAASDEQREIMQKFRDLYESLSEEIKTLPISRGVSLALTNLEQSSFWLNKAITNND
jgi:hypothetical protein